MRDLLHEIQDFYRANASVMFDDYHQLKPASEEALARFEETLGARLPEDCRALLLTNTTRHSLRGNYDVLDLDGVIRDWTLMTELLDEGVFDDGRVAHHKANNFGNWDDGRVLPDTWWSRGWVPIARDSCGNMYCVDLTPGPDGAFGQIIAMEVQDGQGPFAHYVQTRRSLERGGALEDRPGDVRGLFEEHMGMLHAGHYRVESWGLEIDW